MVIISPHTELAQAPPENSGSERSQKLKPEKSKLGVFAKILAGMSAKAAIRNAGAGEQALSANAGGVSRAEAGGKGTGEAALVSGGKAKNVRGGLLSVSAEGSAFEAGASAMSAAGTGKTAGKNGAKNIDKSDETGGEMSGFAFLQHEKNLVSHVERLTGRPEKTAATATAAAGLSEVEAAGTGAFQNAGEPSFQTVSVGADAPEGAEPDGRFTAAGMAFSAAETAELSAAEKNKVRAENAGMAELAAAENAGTETLRPDDAKKASVLSAAEKNGRGKLEEVRGREKRRAAGLEGQDSGQAGGYGENVKKEESVNIRAAAEANMPGEMGKDIVLELRLSSAGQEAQHTANSWETNSGRAFEDMLARELHQNFNNDIVRHASVALRDNGEGTIRLALKPESLGNVKIRLEMAENKITGHILVETEEALRAFEREIGSLEKAFRDSGFDAANMQMSLAADGGEARQQRRETEASRILPGFFAASRYDDAADWQPAVTLDLYGRGTQAVNVLA